MRRWLCAGLFFLTGCSSPAAVTPTPTTLVPTMVTTTAVSKPQPARTITLVIVAPNSGPLLNVGREIRDGLSLSLLQAQADGRLANDLDIRFRMLDEQASGLVGSVNRVARDPNVVALFGAVLPRGEARLAAISRRRRIAFFSFATSVGTANGAIRIHPAIVPVPVTNAPTDSVAPQSSLRVPVDATGCGEAPKENGLRCLSLGTWLKPDQGSRTFREDAGAAGIKPTFITTLAYDTGGLITAILGQTGTDRRAKTSDLRSVLTQAANQSAFTTYRGLNNSIDPVTGFHAGLQLLVARNGQWVLAS